MKPRSSSGVEARVAAAHAVAAVLDGRTLDSTLPALLAPFDARDRALLQGIAYGTVRWWPRIAHHLDTLLHKPADTPLRALIACGIYQAGWMRVPPHAAVASSVDAAAGLGLPQARGLVNAVLRNYIRDRDTLEAAADADPAARHAHPAWLVDAIREDWPRDHARILAANNAHAPMCLRVNRRHGTRDDYLRRLAASGIEAAPSPHADDAVTLAGPCSVDALPGFDAGDVSVQDAASQLAAGLLGAGPGMRVLDACAAPGGKTCHLLERHPDLASLVAADIDAARFARLSENLARLRLEAELKECDASDPATWRGVEPFDRILVDAPCSATGVIRRHPDIRLLRRAGDIPVLAARQRDLLAALWPVLAPGGRLLYATCSVLRAENDAVIGAMLDALPGARAVAVDAAWGRPTAHGRQVLPGDDAMDGFHYACLSKSGGPENA